MAARLDPRVLDRDSLERDAAVAGHGPALDPERLEPHELVRILVARLRQVELEAQRAVLRRHGLGEERGARRPALQIGLEAHALEVRRDRLERDPLARELELGLALIARGDEAPRDRELVRDPVDRAGALDARAVSRSLPLEDHVLDLTVAADVERDGDARAVVPEVDREVVERDLAHVDGRQRGRRGGLGLGLSALRAPLAPGSEPEDAERPVGEPPEAHARAVEGEGGDEDLLLREVREDRIDPPEVDLVIVGLEGDPFERELARVEASAPDVGGVRVRVALDVEREVPGGDLDVGAEVRRELARMRLGRGLEVEDVRVRIAPAAHFDPEVVEDPGRDELEREGGRLGPREGRDLVAAHVEEELALEGGLQGLVLPLDVDVVDAEPSQEDDRERSVGRGGAGLLGLRGLLPLEERGEGGDLGRLPGSRARPAADGGREFLPRA